MTIEEIRELDASGIETRISEIKAEMDADGADINALSAEVDALAEHRAALKKAAEERAALAEKVAQGEGEVIEEIKTEERKMTNEEVRASKEYIDAYAKYIKTNDATECRALLTELAEGGSLPVPLVVEGRVRTAWAKLGIMDLVRKTYVPGVLRIGFELSATGAVVHTEGTSEPDEETLTLGVVTMTPESVKKWIDRVAA